MQGIRRGNSGERGATLVIAIFFVSTVTVLSYAMISMVNTSSREQRGSREEIDALYVCEAGVAAAVANLQSGGEGNVGSEQNPVAFGSASYHVTATDMGGGLTSLVATGRGSREETRIRVVLQETQSRGLLDWAAFGDDGLTMDQNAMVDSYDSSAGSYEDQEVNGSGSDTYAGEDGDVGTNGDVVLGTNSYVHGDASPGTSGSVVLNGNSGVSGSTVPMPDAIVLPPIVVPVLPPLGDMTVPGNSSQTIASGDYHYANFHVDNNSTLTITGPARLVVTNFLVDSGSEIVVDASNGPVEFFVEEDFLVNSNITIASTTFDPADVRFNLLSDNIIDPSEQVDLDDVTFDSNSMIFGVLYAPEAHVEIDSNFELFGSLVARSVHLDSNSKVHYDVALQTAAQGGSSGSSGYQTLCWLSLPSN